MVNPLIVGGCVLAVAAAIRGLWSPCGLSMISTITPLSERARGHHYGVTAVWFLVGAGLGGVTLGSALAGGAWAVDQVGLHSGQAAGLVMVASLVTIASDLRIFGWSLWNHPRQVDETWLTRLRAWAYASGFGWQIGVGLATYIMTAGNFLLLVVGIASADPIAGLLLGSLFGLVRGLVIFAAARADTPQRLRRVHELIDRFTGASKILAVVAQLVVFGLCALVAPVWLVIPLTIVAGAGIVIATRRSDASEVCALEPIRGIPARAGSR